MWKWKRFRVVIGEFGLTKIIDGDTVGVDGLDSSLRLLGIDTEETYKNQADRLASDADFVKYLADKRAGHSRPVKAATPLGEDAKTWAKHFFAGVDKVRLERDNPRQIRGRYNRYLAYVFAFKNGQWVNYNVEAVRAGMSPYFTKYGYSRRFHQEFVDAEREAKAAHLGIWDPTKLHYPDYAERKPWWTARAEFDEDVAVAFGFKEVLQADGGRDGVSHGVFQRSPVGTESHGAVEEPHGAERTAIGRAACGGGVVAGSDQRVEVKDVLAVAQISGELVRQEITGIDGGRGAAQSPGGVGAEGGTPMPKSRAVAESEKGTVSAAG